MSILYRPARKKKGEAYQVITVAELIQFIQAAHVSQHTDWDFDARGGIVLCAYPEQLKTTIVSKALGVYSQAEVLSDINAQQLNNLRGELLKQNIMSLGFLDYQKIWERDERTSSHTEGVIRALADEGWKGLPSKSGARGFPPARALVVLCITPSMLEDRWTNWEQTGFKRRFMILNYRFAANQIEVLQDAVGTGRPYRLSENAFIPLPSNRIPVKMTTEEFSYIKAVINENKLGKLVPLQFLTRVYNTLKWYYTEHWPSQMENVDIPPPMRILMNIVPLLGKEGGELVLQRSTDEKNLGLVNPDGTVRPPRKPRKMA